MQSKHNQFIRFKFFIRQNQIYSIIPPTRYSKRELWGFSSSFLYNPSVWSIGIIPKYNSVEQFYLIQNDVAERSSNLVVWLNSKASFRVWREMDQLLVLKYLSQALFMAMWKVRSSTLWYLASAYGVDRLSCWLMAAPQAWRINQAEMSGIRGICENVGA